MMLPALDYRFDGIAGIVPVVLVGLAILTGKRKAPADRFHVNGSNIQRGLPTVSEVHTQNTAQFEAFGVELPTTR